MVTSVFSRFWKVAVLCTFSPILRHIVKNCLKGDWLSPNMSHNDCSQSHCLCFLLLFTASTGAAKTSQKTAPQRNPGSKGSPSSSLQRLPSLSSALPSTTGSSTSSTSAGAWKGSPNASGNPSARGASHASTSGVKTASKTTKEKTYVYEKKTILNSKLILKEEIFLQKN